MEEEIMFILFSLSHAYDGVHVNEGALAAYGDSLATCVARGEGVEEGYFLQGVYALKNSCSGINLEQDVGDIKSILTDIEKDRDNFTQELLETKNEDQKRLMHFLLSAVDFYKNKIQDQEKKELSDDSQEKAFLVLVAHVYDQLAS